MRKSIKTCLSVGVVAGLLAAGVVGYRFMKRSDDVKSDAPAADERRPVVLEQVRSMVFEDRIVVSGDVEAKNTVQVSARIPGVVDDIFVDEGQYVKVGQKLFQTDKIKLTRSVEAAEQQVSVATAMVNARRATMERVRVDLDKARIDFERFKRLREQDNAVTRNAVELQESRFKQVQAALKEAQAGRELADAQAQQAKSNLGIVRKDMADSLVAAPISGRVSKRMLEPGEMAGAGTPVLRIEDLEVVELVAYLPEAYYSRVVIGSTQVRADVQGASIGQAVVTFKSPTIDRELRTFEIKALVRKPPAGVVPGALVEMLVVFEKHTALGVPRVAAVRRGKGLVVFTARDGIVRMLPVSTGLEVDGWLEVRADGLADGVSVVCMGQDNLNDGMSVVQVTEDAE